VIDGDGDVILDQGDPAADDSRAHVSHTVESGDRLQAGTDEARDGDGIEVQSVRRHGDEDQAAAPEGFPEAKHFVATERA
jgi:hypothetical protein